ncbi:MAG: phosphate/phosphite/phosphonate ABC transporter substrate-binding protein [Actinomycetota bacterium]
MTTDRDTIRFTTWLAPGLPLGMYEEIAAHVSRGLGRDHELSVEPKISGPISVADDRFTQGLTDVGFLCPPSYLWLTEGSDPSVTLVPLAPVHDDPRNGGRPQYVSDVIVRKDSGITSFADLEGRRVGYNEPASLSGFVSMLARLDRDELGVDFFGEWRQVGSHRAALTSILSGEIDAAAIDANVLRTWASENPDAAAALRSVDVLGPFPVQPVVARASAGSELVDALAAELARPELAAALRPFGVVGFGPISHEAYADLAPMVARAMALVAH